MQTIQTLDLNDARTIIDAGIAEAERIGSPSNIAVVDAGGCSLRLRGWTMRGAAASTLR